MSPPDRMWGRSDHLPRWLVLPLALIRDRAQNAALCPGQVRHLHDHYVKLQLAGLHDIDYRTKTFSCARCGAPANLCVVNPSSETGVEDYRLDELERPTHHPNAVRRLNGADRPRINFSGRGEQPGRKVDPRR